MSGPNRQVDVVVIGGGPAGLAAATWLGRYRSSVVVVDSAQYRNRWTERAHGYLGSDPIAPRTLLDNARSGLEQYPGVSIVNDAVVSISGNAKNGFVIEAEAQTFECRRVILATGVVDRFPEVRNFFEHYGSTVFHCPSCDGFEARGLDIVVFGWSQHVTGFALGLLNWAKSVTIVSDGRSFEGTAKAMEKLSRHGIRVIEDDAVELLGKREHLEGVLLKGGQTVPCQMCFFSIAHSQASGLAEGLGCDLNDEGCVMVDAACETTVKGVYAVGDMTPGFQLVQIATAKGVTAGVSCARSLMSERRALD